MKTSYLKRLLLIFVTSWVVVVGVLLSFHVYHDSRHASDSLTAVTKNIWQLMSATRSWNAHHGGIYTPVTKDNPPNPYLDTPDANVQTNLNQHLTKINPAYMTRQISEILARRDGIQIRLISDNPLNPKNTPNLWELKSIEQFKQGQTSLSKLSSDDNNLHFTYIAPLLVNQQCLKCHSKQGYTPGEVKGAMSITLTNLNPPNHTQLYTNYAIILLIGLALIGFYFRHLREAYTALEGQAFIDPLLNIYNRRYFMEHSAFIFYESRRQQQQFSLLICDVDDFKLYNDTYGHLAGDYILHKVANALQDSLKRRTDLLARFGGEEFVILLPDTGKSAAQQLANDLINNIQALNIKNDSHGLLSISIGVSTFNPDNKSSEQLTAGDDANREQIDLLIKQADSAMYQSKRQGKNQAFHFDDIDTSNNTD